MRLAACIEGVRDPVGGYRLVGRETVSVRESPGRSGVKSSQEPGSVIIIEHLLQQIYIDPHRRKQLAQAAEENEAKHPTQSENGESLNIAHRQCGSMLRMLPGLVRISALCCAASEIGGRYTSHRHHD